MVYFHFFIFLKVIPKKDIFLIHNSSFEKKYVLVMTENTKNRAPNLQLAYRLCGTCTNFGKIEWFENAPVFE